jgi:hypothetical protein
LTAVQSSAITATVNNEVIQMVKSVNELKNALAEAERLEHAALIARRAVVKVIKEYRCDRIVQSGRRRILEHIHDPAIAVYEISYKTVNYQEAYAVGHPWISAQTSVYLFNTASNRLVCIDRGGILMLDNNKPGLWDAMSKFITENPEGGIVTDIMTGNYSS